MPNTYSQIHIQFVFAVKYRQALIAKAWKQELHQYITGIVQNKSHKMLQINTMPDHLHMLVGFRPDDNMSKLIQVVKVESTKFINEKKLTPIHFSWQEGFGAFSYSRSHVKNVIAYIQNQEQHHAQKTFLKEYTDLLDAFEIEYDPKYIFKEPID